MPRLKLKKKDSTASADAILQASALDVSPAGQAFVEEVDHLADEAWTEQPNIPALAEPPESLKARRVKRLTNGFFLGAVFLCLAITAVMLLNTFSNGLFGLRFFVEPTDAMAPDIPRGSLLITVNRKPDRIEPGDIITYLALPRNPESPRLTRYVDERSGNEGNYHFRTKRPGDAAPDSIVINTTSILGVKVAVLPRMGFAISFVRIYAGGFAVIAAALCAAAVLLRRWIRPRKERNDVQTLL